LIEQVIKENVCHLTNDIIPGILMVGKICYTQHPNDGRSGTGVGHHAIDLSAFSSDDSDGIVSWPQGNLRQSCKKKKIGDEKI
jgi:hypothetical protein